VAAQRRPADHDAVRRAGVLPVLAALLLGVACAPVAAPPPDAAGAPPRPGTAELDPAQAARIQRLMVPLIRAMNNPVPLDRVQVGVIADDRINAATAGGGQFFVTTGLLEQANDDQLLGVLAHEVAHNDLRHVPAAQARHVGLQIGTVLLDQLIPGTGAVTPVVGALVDRAYSRRHEYEADTHGAELLRRIGRDKDVMIEALTWLKGRSGAQVAGGFFSTHPATGDRIEALRQLP
jgi:Zn-dependent protease with chaperone function